MVSIHVLATPIRGRLRSASVNPMALNMERAPVRSRPSVIPRLMCLRSIVRDYRTHTEDVKREAFQWKLGNPLGSRLPQLHDAAQEPSCLSSYCKLDPTRARLHEILRSILPPEDAVPSTLSRARPQNSP